MTRRDAIIRVLVGLAAAVAVVWARGFTFAAAKDVVLLAWLVAIAARDAREFRIPNGAVLGVLACWAVLFALEWLVLPGLRDGLTSAVWAAAGRAFVQSLLGAVVAAGPVLLLTLAQAWRGREGFGGGDVKLLFAVGLWFTWPEDLVGLLVACVAGAIIGAVRKARTHEDRLPFAVAILAGWWVVMMCGSRLVAAVVG